MITRSSIVALRKTFNKLHQLTFFPSLFCVVCTTQTLFQKFSCAKRYEKRMNRILLTLWLLMSLASHASPPAEAIELTNENMESHGFKFEFKELGDENYVRLVAPLKIDSHWVPVTTQVYSHDKNGNGTLSKVELGSPSKEVSINAYYKPKSQDLMIGVYYLCSLDRAPCRGNWDSRLYIIESVDKYLITKPSN